MTLSINVAGVHASEVLFERQPVTPSASPSEGSSDALASDASVDFELESLDGRPLRLSSLRGRYVIVNFWATWCGPCVRELPELALFAKRHRDTASVLAINFERIDADTVRQFLEEQGVDLTVLRIGEQPLVPFEPLKGLPTTAIVSPAGEMIAHHTGPVTAAALEAFLAEEAARFAEEPTGRRVQRR